MLRKKLEGYEGAEPLSKTASASVSEVSTPPSPSIVEDEEKEHNEGPVVPINTDTDLTRDEFEFVDRPRIEAALAALDTFDAPIYEDGDDDKTTVVGDDGDVAEAMMMLCLPLPLSRLCLFSIVVRAIRETEMMMSLRKWMMMLRLKG